MQEYLLPYQPSFMASNETWRVGLGRMVVVLRQDRCGADQGQERLNADAPTNLGLLELEGELSLNFDLPLKLILLNLLWKSLRLAKCPRRIKHSSSSFTFPFRLHDLV